MKAVRPLRLLVSLLMIVVLLCSFATVWADSADKAPPPGKSDKDSQPSSPPDDKTSAATSHSDSKTAKAGNTPDDTKSAPKASACDIAVTNVTVTNPKPTTRDTISIDVTVKNLIQSRPASSRGTPS